MSIVKVCAICGGWGKFLGEPCPKCKGSGGKFNKPDLDLVSEIGEIKNTLSEEELKVFNLYKEGLTQKEISRQLDISLSRLILILSHIDKVCRRFWKGKSYGLEQKLF